MSDVPRNQGIKGLVFSATTGTVAPGTNNVLLLLLTHPSGSTKDAALEVSVSSSESKCTLEIRLNPTKTGTFSSTVVANLKAGSAVTAVVTAETISGGTGSVNLTGGTLAHSEFIGAGQRAELQSNGRIVVVSGNTIGFKLTAAGAGDASITAIWTEAPG